MVTYQLPDPEKRDEQRAPSLRRSQGAALAMLVGLLGTPLGVASHLWYNSATHEQHRITNQALATRQAITYFNEGQHDQGELALSLSHLVEVWEGNEEAHDRYKPLGALSCEADELFYKRFQEMAPPTLYAKARNGR